MTLEERITQLESENALLREYQEDFKRKIAFLENRVSFFKDRLEKTIRDKSVLKLTVDHYRRRNKPKLIVVDNDRELRRDYNDLYDMMERLKLENDLLYENNRKLEEENSQYKSVIDTCEELTTEYANETETLRVENEELKNQNQQLKAKVISKDITINSYMDRKDRKNGIINYGTEIDLYSGEHKDIVLEILKERFKSLDPYTRQYSVIKSILEANPEDGTRADIKRTLYTSLKQYTGTDHLHKSTVSELRSIGFEIEQDLNHDKLTFNGDKRYMCSLACTPNRSSRGGLNAASDAVKIFL